VTDNAATRLLQHYVDNFRRLPWRSPPGSPAPDPYRVWLSEVMLQQTTVATVQARFTRFLDRWPTVADLAAAPDSDVMSEWAGLGYYARARNLLACARAVAESGWPRSAGKLRALPGIGAYTAAAIAAIAFGEDSAPVDTNVERVLARLDGVERPDREAIERRFLELCPSGRAGDFAQALMDLGATLCRPRNPKCGACPIKENCAAFASGEPARFPTPKARSAKPRRFGIAHWSERGAAVWLVRRPERGLLGGMAALPGTDFVEVDPAPRDALAKVRHVFTHFSLDLYVLARGDAVGEGWWQPIDRLSEAGLPTLYARAAAATLAAREHPNRENSTRLEVDRTTP
jgi:A/G-specific adenine glycosylase